MPWQRDITKGKRKFCSFIKQLCSTVKVSLTWKKIRVDNVVRLLGHYINILADYKMRKKKNYEKRVFRCFLEFDANYCSLIQSVFKISP